MSNTDRLTNWFQMAMEESNQFYIDDIRDEGAYSNMYETRLDEEIAEAECEDEEEFLEYLNNQYDDPIDWYVDNFGKEMFGAACLVALGYKRWEDFR